MLSACLLLPLIDHSPAHPFNLPPPLRTPPSFQGSLRNGLAMWGYSGTKKGCDLCDPQSRPPWPRRHTFSLSNRKQKQILSCASVAQKDKKKTLISMWSFDNHLSTWPVIFPTGSAWHLQQRGDGTQVVHLSPRLPLSPLLSISLLTPPCVHNLISKQGVDSHYGNPGKWPGHFPPYLGSPSGERTLALTAPLVQSLCVFWWAYAAEMAFTLHWLQWDWPTRLTLFESTTHFNNVTKQNRVLMLNKTFLRSALGKDGGLKWSKSVRFWSTLAETHIYQDKIWNSLLLMA